MAAVIIALVFVVAAEQPKVRAPERAAEAPRQPSYTLTGAVCTFALPHGDPFEGRKRPECKPGLRAYDGDDVDPGCAYYWKV